ncbi:aminotransferase class I/II-fold pyridoxal phosphate-dependent enzyme [Catenulispora subtropica]|uniref:aminotransferase class I/II-fold pyridoxal phosphate-dependent enzyme n=1 Tax=Catenulispora subtropica TaxID=450798 RepID=UPI0031CDC116
MADEVYRGTERLADRIAPTFWGRGDRIVCVGSLSKAFGLPGLRLGWLAGPPGMVEAAWRVTNTGPSRPAGCRCTSQRSR